MAKPVLKTRLMPTLFMCIFSFSACMDENQRSSQESSDAAVIERLDTGMDNDSPMNCDGLLGAGIQILDTPIGQVSVYCDEDEWLLFAKYKTGQEIPDFNILLDQVQQGSLDSMTPESDDFGHRGYELVNPRDGELRFECGPLGQAVEFSVTTDVVESWTEDRTHGEYGSADWVSLGQRNHHYACGDSVLADDDERRSIGACTGLGGSGLWDNHQVSYNNWNGGKIGCNGGEITDAQVLIWYRPSR